MVFFCLYILFSCYPLFSDLYTLSLFLYLVTTLACCLTLCQLVCLSACLCIFIRPSVCLSVCLSRFIHVLPSVSLSVCSLSVPAFTYLFPSSSSTFYFPKLLPVPLSFLSIPSCFHNQRKMLDVNIHFFSSFRAV